MMDAVHRFEGTVKQVAGDGIMALFGAPMAYEDHAIRACYAALAMQAALRSYADDVHRTHGLPLQFRIGLNAGEVVMRAIRTDLPGDYSADWADDPPGGTHGTGRPRRRPSVHGRHPRLVAGLVGVKALGPCP